MHVNAMTNSLEGELQEVKELCVKMEAEKKSHAAARLKKIESVCACVCENITVCADELSFFYFSNTLRCTLLWLI